MLPEPRGVYQFREQVALLACRARRNKRAERIAPLLLHNTRQAGGRNIQGVPPVSLDQSTVPAHQRFVQPVPPRTAPRS